MKRKRRRTGGEFEFLMFGGADRDRPCQKGAVRGPCCDPQRVEPPGRWACVHGTARSFWHGAARVAREQPKGDPEKVTP